MADFMFPEARSRIMASIRGRDTRPEMHVRRAVWRRGFRYRLGVVVQFEFDGRALGW